MKLVKLSSSLVLASALFTSLLPVSAVRADDNSALFGQLAGKIQCSDVGLGSNTQNNHGGSSSARNNSASSNSSASGKNASSQSSNSSNKDGGGGGFNLFGIIGASGSGQAQSSDSSSSNHSSSYNRGNASNQASGSRQSSSYNRDSSTVVVGKDCDSNNAAAAVVITTLDTNKTAKEMNSENNTTSRYGIDAQIKINDSNNKTAVDLFNAQRRSGAVNNLTQWYTPQH